MNTLRGTGCKLDSGNLGIIAFAWKQLTQNAPNEMRGIAQVMDKNSDTYKVMKAKDPALLGMLRNWFQCTDLITDEINARIVEMNKIVEQLNKQQQEAQPKPFVMEEETKTASSNVLVQDGEEFKLPPPDARA